MGDLNDAAQLDWEIHTLRKQCTFKLLNKQEIHFGQPPLLFTLKLLGSCNQNELAKTLNVTPPAIAVSLKRMEKSGLLKRAADPNDLRSNRIELTEKGVASADLAERAVQQVTNEAYAGFSREEFDQFITFYQRMQQNLTALRQMLDENETE